MKKNKKILFSALLGIVAIGSGIAIPIYLTSNKSKKDTKTSKEKLLDLVKKVQILEETNDYDLSVEKNQTKILNHIKSKTSFLTNEEKNSIKLISKNIVISYDQIQNIKFKITLNAKEEEYTFKFKRKVTNQERFNNLIAKFNKSEINKTLKLVDIVDLNLNEQKNRIKVKNAIVNEVNRVNSEKTLSLEEIKLIKITTNSGIITHSNSINIIVEISLDSNIRSYTFQFSRMTIREKFNFLDNYIVGAATSYLIAKEVYVLPETNDLDLNIEQNRIRVKNFIINKINLNNFLSEREKNNIIISFITKLPIINSSNISYLGFMFSFFGNETTGQIKLKTTIS